MKPVMIVKDVEKLKGCGEISMNDPEVMERIAVALERIAWILGGKE